MTGVLQVGPLALPYVLIATIAAIGGGWLVGVHVARRRGVDADGLLARMLLVGVVAARLAFVLQWPRQYLDQPLAMLDIRDGGWEWFAGVAVALLYGIARTRARPALRRPALAATLVTGAVLLASSVGLALWLPALTLPQLSLESLDGRPVDLASFRGRPVVVNLWATWCPPCRRELPVLQQAQAANPDVDIVFANQGEARETVGIFLRRHAPGLRNVLLDRQFRIGSAIGHGALPTTLFFDSRGELVGTRVGELSAATLAQRLSQLRVSRARAP
jgi:thiol-disulfide isomerase/thioredoxin